MIYKKSKKFVKYESKILDLSLLNLVVDALKNIEEATELKEIKNLKKMVGSSNAYRIKIKTHRICFYFDENIIKLEKIAHRKDVYNDFP